MPGKLEKAAAEEAEGEGENRGRKRRDSEAQKMIKQERETATKKRKRVGVCTGSIEATENSPALGNRVVAGWDALRLKRSRCGVIIHRQDCR